MPAQTAAVINPANVIFAKGYLFGTIAGGLADDVPFAELMDVSIKSDLTFKEMRSSEQLTAAAVGIDSHRVTGSAKYGKVRARQFKMLRGGSAAYSSPSTTLTIGVADEPKVFNLHLKSPSDGSDLEVKIYGCLSPSLNVPLAMNDFVIPDFTFEAYGDGVKIMDIILPGDQTTS
jgi:hypothetical protein